MYKSVSISNFRCFNDITLDELERINLIVGKNNAGKTTLLEALFLHCGSSNPDLIFKLDVFRGIENIKVEFGHWTENPWDSLFTDFDSKRDIEIIGVNSISGKRILKIHVLNKPEEFSKISELKIYELESLPGRIREKQEIRYDAGLGQLNVAKVIEFNFRVQNYKREGKSKSFYLIIDPTGKKLIPFPPPPLFPAFYQSPKIKPLQEATEQFSQLERKGKQDILLNSLKIIEPRLKRLSILMQGGVPVIHGDIGLSRLVPLPLMGEGMVTITKMILNIANAPDGVVLIDEIENGIHHSVLEAIWAAIRETAREFNVQVFATTHSMENVIAAHKSFSKSQSYDFRLFRLERQNGLIKAIVYDKETLATAITKELEVR